MDEIKEALNRAVKALDHHGVEEAELEGSWLVAAYRSDLPKEGPLQDGEARYDELCGEEYERIKAQVGRGVLAKHRVVVEFGEKSWVYLSIDVKDVTCGTANKEEK